MIYRNSSKIQSKGLLSSFMMVAIGTASVLNISVAGHNVDLDGRDDMEELSLKMAAAAEHARTHNG